uniref:Long-chain-fatty-acid--CoA ligase n=1 Tax=Piliocolobus tephrosceles TaxID=591936 RepID=A0A8C9H5C8_9PRIM
MFTINNQRVYSIKVQEPENENETGIYRNPTFKDKLIDNFEDEPINSLWELFDKTTNKFKKHDCLGTRVKLPNGKLGPYKWKSYEEVRELIITIGSGLINIDACPLIDVDDYGITSCRFLGLYLSNCEEWNISDIACNAFNIINVTLYDSLGSESSNFILNQTEMQTILCNKTCAVSLFNTLNACDDIYLKKIILVESEIDEEIKKLNETHELELITWNDLLEAGKKNILEPTPGTLDDIYSICYTSGTTSYPKGVIMKNGNCIAQIASSHLGPCKLPALNMNEHDTHISYLPLAHIYERIMLLIFQALGTRVGYYSGNIQKVLEDIQELKPTLFISVPRLYNRLHERIFSSLKKKPTVLQMLFNKGLDQKLKKMKSYEVFTHFLWDRLIFNKAKKVLGGNIRAMLNSSAPLDGEITKKLKCIFSVPIADGYGMTETLGPSFVTDTFDKNVGHIGGPLPCVEFKIVSVPEMNYLVTDEQPRGELYIRGPAVCTSGYFKLEKETSEAFLEGGWIATGDIVTFNKNGSTSIIDRKKNIYKLAQGEYVAVEKIESYYRQSLHINQIFVYGYSHESFLVSVICPSVDALNQWMKEKKIKKTHEEIIQMDQYKKDVLDELINIGKKCGLHGFEQIKDIYFTLEEFTIQNNLMTPTAKIKRHEAFKKFKVNID